MESTKNCMEKNMDLILMELKETLKDFKIINEKTYKGNENVKIDYMEAAKWIQQAAHAGFAKAQFQLAQMHANGEGVPQDYSEAAKWYKLAASQGHTKAQFQLGMLYKKGFGVAQDYQKATQWLKQSIGGE